MLELVSEEIEAYCREHSSGEDPLLSELARATYESAQQPQMQTGHLAGLFLRLLVRLLHAERALEIGTFTGYSALSMAMGLPGHGRVVTCDVDERHTAMAREFWSKSPHGLKIDLRLGRALETVAQLEGPFDLVFIDADKEQYIEYWEAVLPKLRPGGAIVVDNTLWSGRVLAPSTDLDYAVARFNAHAAADPRVELAVLPIRDGMTLAWKKGEAAWE